MTRNPKIWKNPVSLEPPGPRAHAPGGSGDENGYFPHDLYSWFATT